MVLRIYVEKKAGYEVEAQEKRNDYRENLNIPELQNVRILNRYDIEGLSEEDFQKTVSTVFSEPSVDKVYFEQFPREEGDIVFGVEFLPGQYDQRSDSAAQCVQLLTLKERPEIRSARIFVLTGNVSDAQVAAIKNYEVNPVDSRIASERKPDTLKMNLAVPTKVETVEGFISMEEDQLERYRGEMGFAMSRADIVFVQEYFRKEQRDPTITELKVIDTYWSDHCRHTTFLTRLEETTFEEDEASAQAKQVYEDYLQARRQVYGQRKKNVCLMDLATIYTKWADGMGMLKGLDDSEEINACTIRERVKVNGKQEDYLILFKNETHNHPTEIEPFGGAATCLGGAIRDPLSGRAYVYQAMRVTGASDPNQSVADTMEGKLPQKKITTEAAHGYSSYGNQIGLATGLVDEIYHPGYAAKRMEIGAVIAAAPAKNVVREHPLNGDIILLIGGRTGRDGCGGATGSSKAHDLSSITECGAEVQKGNPLTERKLQRLFRNGEFSRLVKRCNDFGAGGVSVAIGELAPGLDIDLNAVPKKYEGLTGTELAISESQERMAVVVAKENVERALALAAQENLEATVVAEVTDTQRMRLFWNGEAIVDLSREFLDSNGATQTASAHVALKPADFSEQVKPTLAQTLSSLMQDLNICSKKGLSERFDSTIGAGSVLMPFGGKNQQTPQQSMAAKVPVEAGESGTATIMAYGFDPYLSEQNPFVGAANAILLSVAKAAAAGGEVGKMWLTLQEYFERMTGAPEVWGKPLAALLGAYAAQKGLGIAAIGGKDSMSGSFMDLHVPPTLVSFAVCAQDVDKIVSNELKAAGDQLSVLRIQKKDGLPDFAQARIQYEKLAKYIRQGKVKAARAVERGGILVAAAKMGFGNGIGIALDGTIQELTERAYGDILVESEEPLDGFEQIGSTLPEFVLRAQGQTADLNQALAAFAQPLSRVFPETAESGREEVPVPASRQGEKRRANISAVRPKVVIPVFPGTNCEYDTANAFERAGAAAHTVILRNLTARDIDESIEELSRQIANAQIVMIPGGFSGGDEPDGSGKFIATVFRNPRVKQAVEELLYARDGLMLGICNGFQALIKLGLVPYGEIRPMRDDSPTLTYNTIGRHVSTMVTTRVASNLSPWLMETQVGDLHTVPVSHGEGRFVATPEEIARLAAAGQIATQYVDLDGQPTMRAPYNPNGSLYAIEGITSPDGRVFGKMAHSERYTKGTFQNIVGEKDQKLFASGVKYFL